MPWWYCGRAPGPRPSTPPSKETVMPSQLQKTLLVVEDDDVTREGLAIALRQAGYAVVPAANGLEALNALRAGPRPEAILLDMLLPVLDGWHFLKRLGVEGPQPP